MKSSAPSVRLLAILLLGAALRLHALGRQSFWLDEAYTWAVVVNTSWRSMWSEMLLSSTVTPLSFVLTKLTAPLFGVTEFGLRASGALMGWLAIPVTFRLGRAMFGRAEGLLAAAIIALSPFAVWYAQDARSYGLYLFLAAVALWGFWRAGRGRGWGLFVVSSAALYLTHYVAALFVYAQAAFLLARLRRQRMLFRRWAVAQLLAVLPVAGWVTAFVAQGRRLTSMAWIPPITPVTPLQTLWNFVSGDAARWSPPMIVGVIVLVGLLARGAGRPTPAGRLLLWWLGLPLAAGWLFSLRQPSYVDRFFEPAILGLALLLAAGLTVLPRSWRAIAIPVTLIGLLAGSARLFIDLRYTKEDWRGAAQAIKAAGVPVGLPDAEVLLGLQPYASRGVAFAPASTEAELSARLAGGPFMLVLRSPHESAHAFTNSAPFDPLTEGPEFFRRWRADHPNVRMKVLPFTGLALIQMSPK